MNKNFIFLAAIVLSSYAASLCASEKGVRASSSTGIANAWKMFRLGEYDQALKLFEKASTLAPDSSEDKLACLYGIAKTYQLRSPSPDYEEAGKVFRQIADTAPNSDLAAWSLLSIARMAHLPQGNSMPDYDEVRKLYQEVIDKYPGHMAAEEAFIYQQASYLATLEKDDAAKALENVKGFLEKNPKSKFASSAWAIQAEAFSILERSQERLDAIIKSVDLREIDPSNPIVEKASDYWKIATVAEFELGDFDTARKYYAMLRDEYPTDARCYGAKLAIERMNAKEDELIKAGKGN